ncbi:MAG: isoprenylcysteine carboxylmethyltransferase family protein [Methanobrevibacter sp.]|nr:isoprenylcysteine carboxylmethyltransferase family protein [Methanobrevibacter sp.]
MNRDFIGYLLGLIIFIIGIPYVMYLASGSPNLAEIGLRGLLILIILAITGIGLSVWSFVYMKNVGGGNPFDAFNHEVAPRTSSLMTDGPYGICRNPMLLGVFIYHIGVLIALLSVESLLIFIIEVLIMNVQVKKEEQRLKIDFGKDYEEYVKNSNRFFPKLK